VTLLETDRLFLREFEEADFPSVHEYASNPEVVRFPEWGPNTQEDTRTFIRNAASRQTDDPRDRYDLAVVRRQSNALVGGCSIKVWSRRHRSGYIGCYLNRRFRGNSE